MRKADYAALAAIIHKHADNAAARKAVMETMGNQSMAMTEGAQIAAIRAVAREFAACANVNATDFLKACGIDK